MNQNGRRASANGLTEARPNNSPAVRRRLLGVLLGAVVCGSTGHAIAMTFGGIVAADLTGTNAWAGVPVAVGALGTALASLPLSRLMGRWGRRPGLVLGYGLAMLGSGLAMAGALAAHLGLFLLGMGFYGISNSSNLLARYAAADVAPSARRGLAIGLTVGAATVGALIGPNLLDFSAHLGGHFGLPPVGSPFLIGVGGFGMAALLIATLLRPDPLAVARALAAPTRGAAPAVPARSLRAIVRQPAVQVALGALMMSQLVMIATTSTAPVYLRDQGHGLHTVGLAASLHIAGMYATSPLTGWLADRLGRLTVILVGALLLTAAIAWAALVPGSDSFQVIVALILNGVGWNFGFVAGSALLTDALRPAERTTLQGLADLATGLMGALGSAAGGVILQAWGFIPLNAAGALLVLGPLAVFWLRPAIRTLARPAVLAERR